EASLDRMEVKVKFSILKCDFCIAVDEILICPCVCREIARWMRAWRALRLPRLARFFFRPQIRVHLLETRVPPGIGQMQQLVGNVQTQDLPVQTGHIDYFEITGVNLWYQHDHRGEAIDIAGVKDQL